MVMEYGGAVGMLKVISTNGDAMVRLASRGTETRAARAVKS